MAVCIFLSTVTIDDNCAVVCHGTTVVVKTIGSCSSWTQYRDCNLNTCHTNHTHTYKPF